MRLGYEKVAELLLHYGARIDAKDFFDRTPIYLAAIEGHLKVVELLTKKGATFELPDRNQALKGLSEKNAEDKSEQDLAKVKGNH